MVAGTGAFARADYYFAAAAVLHLRAAPRTVLHAGNHQRLTRMNTNIHPNFAKNIFQDNAVTEPSVEFNEPVVAAPPRSNADIVAEQNAPLMARCFGPQTKGESVKLNDKRVPARAVQQPFKQI